MARLVGLRDALSAQTLSRLISVPLALGSGGVLAAARWVDPSPQGHGTHLQLGLRPCSVLAWTGYPCPMCGATTSFALWADLRPLDAFLNQPFAALLFVLCLALLGISTAEIVAPRRRWQRLVAWIEPYEGWAAGGFLLAMALGWGWKVLEMNPPSWAMG